MIKRQSMFVKDPAQKKLTITREFDAPLPTVWKAWTDSTILDQWWAPKPWKARTRTMDFREGGQWVYCMIGPDGEMSWAKAEYKTVVTQKSFTGIDAFCDEEGNINTDFPRMHWDARFNATNAGTQVVIVITFSSEADMAKIVELGFQEGFTAAHENLDELLTSQLAAIR